MLIVRAEIQWYTSVTQVLSQTSRCMLMQVQVVQSLPLAIVQKFWGQNSARTFSTGASGSSPQCVRDSLTN